MFSPARQLLIFIEYPKMTIQSIVPFPNLISTINYVYYIRFYFLTRVIITFHVRSRNKLNE